MSLFKLICWHLMSEYYYFVFVMVLYTHSHTHTHTPKATFRFVKRSISSRILSEIHRFYLNLLIVFMKLQISNRLKKNPNELKTIDKCKEIRFSMENIILPFLELNELCNLQFEMHEILMKIPWMQHIIYKLFTNRTFWVYRDKKIAKWK